MSLLSLILVLVVIGFVLWVINHLIPMEPRIRTIMNVVVAVVVVVWILQALGLWGTLDHVRIGHH